MYNNRLSRYVFHLICVQMLSCSTEVTIDNVYAHFYHLQLGIHPHLRQLVLAAVN